MELKPRYHTARITVFDTHMKCIANVAVTSRDLQETMHFAFEKIVEFKMSKDMPRDWGHFTIEVIPSY